MMKKRRGRTNGFPGRFADCFDVGNGLPAPQEELRGSDGSAEKVKTDIHNIFVNSDKLPNDYDLLTKRLENLGHIVRTTTKGLFVNERFRVTISEGPFVHVVDLRCCN